MSDKREKAAVLGGSTCPSPTLATNCIFATPRSPSRANPTRFTSSGEGAVVAGAGFVRAATDAGVQLDGPEMSFAKAHESGCWMGAAAQSVFAALESGLVDEAQAAFDGALGDAARRSQRLPERGNAALPILRGCGPRRREGLAVRQLAGARQNRDSGLHQRLLIRFELELGARRADLHGKVERRIELAASPLQGEAAKRAT